MSCDQLWQVEAIEEGRLLASDPTFKRHQRLCQECRDRAASSVRLQELLRALPDPTPNELGLRRLRARMLRDAATPKTPWPSWTTSRAALLAAGVIMVVVALAGRRLARHAALPDDSRWAGAVIPADGARWLQARADHVERVSLLEGEVHVAVRKQTPDERFLVVVPDGELEVRGTVFEVVVHAGATRHVRVVEGIVELRLRGGQGPTLTAGQTWDAPTTPRAAAPDASSDVATDRIPRKAPTLSAPIEARPAVARRAEEPTRRSGADDDWTPDYTAAMDLYRAGRFDQAANAFDRFVLAHPGASTIEDALFLQSTSLARAGRPDAAAVVAEHQIARFPRSFHHKEASILVARAARDRGDCQAARRALAAWLAERDVDALRELGGCGP